MIRGINNRLESLGQRSFNIARHIGWSIVFKIGSIIANFLQVPLAIKYLGSQDYGVWLTISSVMSWFMLFDIGLGNGLRNKFAVAKALGNQKEAQAYVSTAYFTLSGIGILLIGLLLVINTVIDWSVVFNTPAEKNYEMSLLLGYVFGFFGLQLVAKLIVSIYQADQHHSVMDKVQFVGQVSILASLWILLNLSGVSLLMFGVIYSAIPVMILMALTIFGFGGRYKKYRPTWRGCRVSHLKDIAGIGIKFFIIQIAAVVLFSTDNIIITQLFGPEEVVNYNIVFKYFSVVTIAYGILITPFWSSFTDAYNKQDLSWIRKIVKTVEKIWLIVPAGLGVMVLLSSWFYRLWIGDLVDIPIALTFSMALYILFMTFGMIYVQFINGVGKVSLQLVVSLVVMIVNIPLSVLFGKYMELGSSGVILATTACIAIPAFLWRIQYEKLVNQTAHGIWSK